MTPYQRYLRTLRRIPKPIRLAMATREFEMEYEGTCLCGWAIRESLAFANGLTADQQRVWDAPESSFVPDACALRFGGRKASWRAIFWGVTDHRLPVIEAAFTQAVVEACR